MTSVVVDLIPMILGAMLAPVWIIIVLLMLASPGGPLKAGAFVLGMTLTRLLQGVLFGTIIGASSDAEAADGGKSPFVSTLLLVVGILLLVAAYRKWAKDADPDEPPPKWMQSIEQLAPLKALGMGALLVAIAVKLWVFTLSAIGVISAAELGLTAGAVAYLIYIALAQLPLIVAVVAYSAAPAAMGPVLKRAIDWLMDNNRPISIAVSLIFGIYFTWTGISSLLT
jgi:Sap, sulfolipid-1-addressing protein